MGLGLVIASIAAGIYILTKLFPKLWKSSPVDESFKKLPGPRPLPFFGNVHNLKVDPAEFLELVSGATTAYRSPAMLRIYLLWYPYLAILGPDEAESILSSTKLINKSREYRLLEPWLGTGLLTNNGDSWRLRRKKLTPTFHYDILKDFVEVFNRQSAVFVGQLKQQVGKEPFDAYPFVTRCALDIICETAMGVDIGAQLTKDQQYLDAIHTINDIIHERQKAPWFWVNWIFNMFGRGREHEKCLSIIHGFREKVFRERNLTEENFANNPTKPPAEREITKKRKLAFLDMLTEMLYEGKLTMDEARMEVDTFMFEGHDTTSVNISWTLYLFGRSPEIQAKAFDEIQKIIPDSGNLETNPETLKQLVYLEACVKESLRLFPSTPLLAREVDEDCEISGYSIPAGTDVIISAYSVHRDPRHWPDPEVFKPERFLPENSVGRHPYAFLPFSAGSRNCIGQRFALMEAKTVLAHVLKSYRVISTDARYLMKPKAELLIRPTAGYRIQLENRKN